MIRHHLAHQGLCSGALSRQRVSALKIQEGEGIMHTLRSIYIPSDHAAIIVLVRVTSIIK